jgi:anion-transporting  ArsA/GET3 family ATPase
MTLAVWLCSLTTPVFVTLRSIPSGLLDKRLVFVTGKGGVGKSTVAAALGMAAARAGRRTIVVELAYQDRLARAFGVEDSHFREAPVQDGLFTISLDPQHALEEYLRMQLRVKPLADLLFSSRMFQYLAVATPGLAEMVTMGKVWELSQRRRRVKGAEPYDLTIVDAPATGHGVAIMRTPKTFADIARVGPVAAQGRTIHRTVTDRRHTGVLAVALPEEMPVNETVMLRDELRRALKIDLDRVVVNGLYPERFGPRHRAALARALEGAEQPVERGALRAALSEHARARAQREQLERLERELKMESVRLPFLFEPELGREQFDALSRELEVGL